jgi:two-component system, NarL family, nitrate/nitrite response regulator NarL
MGEPIATAVVEPNFVVREGLIRILRAPRFRVVSSTALIDASVLDILTRHEHVLVVFGSGLECDSVVKQIAFFRERHLTGRVAVLADRYEPSEVLSAFKVGANGYFDESTTCDAFLKSLELLTLGETLMPAVVLPFLFAEGGRGVSHEIRVNADALTKVLHDDAPHLSEREKSILRYLVEGESNKMIARKIDIAEATVKVHIKAILRKIRVQNRTQAAVWAMNNGRLDSAIGNI